MRVSYLVESRRPVINFQACFTHEGIQHRFIQSCFYETVIYQTSKTLFFLFKNCPKRRKNGQKTLKITKLYQNVDVKGAKIRAKYEGILYVSDIGLSNLIFTRVWFTSPTLELHLFMSTSKIYCAAISKRATPEKIGRFLSLGQDWICTLYLSVTPKDLY